MEVKGLLLRGIYKSTIQKLELGFWPWTQGIRSRLPSHYKIRYVEKFMKQPTPVHYIPDHDKFKINEYGIKTEVFNVPIPLTQPPEADMGLWGGEAFIKGYKKKKNMKLKPSVAHLWKPELLKKHLYSEILDRWMSITVTKRTLDLIDESCGFDFYILKTHEVDLRSKLGMRLKREMLITLVNKSMYPDNDDKCDEMYNKYQEYIIPVEEAEWVGLTLSQAERKQAMIEERQTVAQTKPLKQQYMEQLISDLKLQDHEDKEELPVEQQKSSSWGSGLKGYFGR